MEDKPEDRRQKHKTNRRTKRKVEVMEGLMEDRNKRNVRDGRQSVRRSEEEETVTHYTSLQVFLVPLWVCGGRDRKGWGGLGWVLGGGGKAATHSAITRLGHYAD